MIVTRPNAVSDSGSGVDVVLALRKGADRSLAYHTAPRLKGVSSSSRVSSSVVTESIRFWIDMIAGELGLKDEYRGWIKGGAARERSPYTSSWFAVADWTKLLYYIIYGEVADNVAQKGRDMLHTSPCDCVTPHIMTYIIQAPLEGSEYSHTVTYIIQPPLEGSYSHTVTDKSPWCPVGLGRLELFKAQDVCLVCAISTLSDTLPFWSWLPLNLFFSFVRDEYRTMKQLSLSKYDFVQTRCLWHRKAIIEQPSGPTYICNM